MAAAPSSYGGYAPSSSASLPDAPVCKDFQNGRSAPPSPLLLACSLKSLVCRCRCVRGAQCRYKHEMLDPVPPVYCPPAQMSYMPSAYAAALPLPAADAASSENAGMPLLHHHHHRLSALLQCCCTIKSRIRSLRCVLSPRFSSGRPFTIAPPNSPSLIRLQSQGANP